MKFVWSSDYNIGQELVDRQHMELFRQVGLIAELLSEDPDNEQQLDSAIDSLVAYAREHFADEEREMLAAGVDERHVTKQRMEHKSFMYDITKLRGISVAEDVSARFQRLLTFAANWLVFHTLQTDQLLGVQLRAIEAGMSPAGAYEEAQTTSFGPAINRPVVEALVHLWSGAMGTVHLLETRVAQLESTASAGR